MPLAYFLVLCKIITVFHIWNLQIKGRSDKRTSGLSSLLYLKKYVRHPSQEGATYTMKCGSMQLYQGVSSANTCATKMGLSNVAEGVEDSQTVELLKSFDCQFAQGYHWSKPLPYKDFVEFVKTYSDR